MRRVKDNKYGYRSWSEEELKRFGKFLILPLAVMILIIVILAVDKKHDPQEEPTESITAEAAQEESEPLEESQSEESETAAEPETHDFAVNEVPEIQELMNRYFEAKQSADAETIYQLFGWTDQTGLDRLKRQLQYDTRYTEGYRNIVCYTKPGAAEGSYLVYVSYDLKFKNSLTLAPGLLWNYVKQAEDGNWYLTDSETLNDVELAFVTNAEKTDEIVLLKTQIYAKLRQALENDEQLAESYSILEKQGGAAGARQEETQHEVNVQIGGQAENEEAPSESDTADTAETPSESDAASQE